MFLTLTLLHCFHHRMENCERSGEYVRLNKSHIHYMQPETYKDGKGIERVGCRLQLGFLYNYSDNMLIVEDCKEL